MLPAPCARKASTRWTTPARIISHPTSAFTATAARNGVPIATMPKTISKTPHKIETVEACRTISTGLFCAIKPSLKQRHKPTAKTPRVKVQDRQYGSVDFSREKTFDRRRCWVEPESGIRFRLRVPPSPPPSEWLARRGARKKCLQNLEGRRFRGQNLDNKRVRAVVDAFAYTAFASTMMNCFGVGGKVGCHRVGVEILEGCCRGIPRFAKNAKHGAPGGTRVSAPHEPR